MDDTGAVMPTFGAKGHAIMVKSAIELLTLADICCGYCESGQTDGQFVVAG
jgi:hypothetical protein